MMSPDRAFKASILVVDDKPANLRLLSQLLSEHSYNVRPVLSGAQAIAAAQALPPDLILLDIKMPEMDGYEVSRRLKDDPRTSLVPILFISALHETEDKVKAFEAGGVDYITKPFHADEVLARVRTQLMLQQLRRDLETELAERDNLIRDLQAYAHSVAHDLRSPLAGALGFAQLLDDPSFPLENEERQEYVRVVVESLEKANSIIDELLLLAEVRKSEISIEPLDMTLIVAQSLHRISILVAESGALITHPESWPSTVGYPAWIEEVWVNYITNAIKYGGRPPVIELGASHSDNGEVRFWVQDNGNGLSVEQQAMLFVPLTRLEMTRATGYGLGLSIVQRIVHKLNGRVGIESRGISGEGSRFYFTLPIAETGDASWLGPDMA
ncbi:MAG: hybrid sensor histidine kinase/response regulator [Caldilinea sp.]|nr:hybrid sensor histidine kinase/response regulator [Caldilinea sp.]MCB0152381.1 hybrid sensor histidine kinase/response regulator [Caldilineaceae bacterium]MCB9115028.1 hybrid sensor histidine kinase/response regulator [Caldilineaceae bacterium]MCB9124784.1 hybrid sensor histidine kinase/response regulator [Caldilineaceae bacterium]MCW5843630.1 hybrid sensor histidine kinase/response regulator [Caldilinea sp.]